MRYTDHQEYPLHKENIDQLLKNGFPSKVYSRSFQPNHHIDQPPIKSEAQFSFIEMELKDIIGQKKGHLTVTGLWSDGTLTAKLNPIVCQCDCGAYCIIKASNFIKENIILSCSECGLKFQGFSEQFWNLNQVNLSDSVVSSIFGGENLSIEEFTNVATKQLPRHNPLKELSLDALKILTNQYNGYAIELFALSDDKKHILNPKIFQGGIRKNIINCYMNRPELLNISNVPARLHNRNISQMIGVRHDRIEVIGILKTDNIFTDYTTKRATLVTRCDCGIYSLFNFKTLYKPEKSNFLSCPRCQLLESEIIRREFDQRGEYITAEKAWEILGYVPNKTSVKNTPVNSDVSNTYRFEIKKDEKEFVPEELKQFFGLRFGFVVITDKARRKDLSRSGQAFAVATCDCGLECYFPYKQLNTDTDNPVVLACSQCSHEINNIFRTGNDVLPIGRTAVQFKKRWKYYLHLFNYPKDLEFNPIWRAYLLMKKNNQKLSFKLIVNKLIEASIKRQTSQPVIDQDDGG